MGKTLYLECYSGISGDMTVAALLDLGASEEVLNEVLKTVPDKRFKTKISRKLVSGIDACDFDVVVDKEIDNHDHDMEYLFGHDHGGDAGHSHGDGHDHEHEGDHGHSHGDGHTHEHTHDHTHTHDHRSLGDVLHILSHITMTDGARKIAEDIFKIIAEAEAKAHGMSIEEVHFHEVGAIDSIVDVVAVAVCLDNLGITECIVPVVYEGRGFVHCAHGDMPIPVPAVTAIAELKGLPLHPTDMEAELVTPTGAAILGAIRTSGILPENYTIKKTGIGAGKRAYKRPSMLRAMIVEENATEDKVKALSQLAVVENKDTIVELMTNLDDTTGEKLGFVMEELIKAGARDVHFVPCFMKKNRPGVVLHVLCKADKVVELENLIFLHTSAIGIRRQELQRTILPRRAGEIETKYGKIAAKILTLPDGSERLTPEYESAAALAREKGVSIEELLR